jgi:hypothetical protein
VHAARQLANKTARFRIVISASGAIEVLLKPLIRPVSKRLVMQSGEKHKQEKHAYDVIWTTVNSNGPELIRPL